MTNPAVAAIEAPVETYDWIRTSTLSELVANFARVHILVALFDGNPDKWLEFIAAEGTPDERAQDVPFIEFVRERMQSDPQLIADMRRLVAEFSNLFARRPVPA